MACQCCPIGCSQESVLPVTSLTSADEWLQILRGLEQPESSGDQLPDSLRGFFWMDGNPGQLLLTFAAANFDAASRRLVFRTYSANSWISYKPGFVTRLQRVCCVYDVHFRSAQFDDAVIDAYNFGCCVYPRCCCFFEMSLLPDDLDQWDRPSTICGKKMSYKFKRIALDKSGTLMPTRHMADFVAFANTIGPVALLSRQVTKAAIAPSNAAMER